MWIVIRVVAGRPWEMHQCHTRHAAEWLAGVLRAESPTAEYRVEARPTPAI